MSLNGYNYKFEFSEYFGDLGQQLLNEDKPYCQWDVADMGLYSFV